MLSQFYPPIIGGEEQHVRTLSIELAARGHDVVVVTLWHEGMAVYEFDQGVRIYRIHAALQRLPSVFSNQSRPYAPPLPDPEVVLELMRILKKEQPQIVHAHNWLVHSFLPLKAWSGARLVVTLHNYSMVCAKSTLLYEGALCQGPAFHRCLACATDFYGRAKGIPTMLGNWSMSLFERRSVDMFLAVSRAVVTGNELARRKLPFQVIPNFIPDDITMLPGDTQPYIQQLPIGDYLLFVGAFNLQKGVHILLQAYSELRRQEPQASIPPLVMIGYKTPEWEALSAACPAHTFVLTDWPRHAVMAAWRHCLLALAPFQGADACPTTVMEAMSAGKPVIGSRVGGLVDLIDDGETGYLIPPGDPCSLQHAIERLLRDEYLRNRMGQAALRKADTLKAMSIVPRIERVYAEVAA